MDGDGDGGGGGFLEDLETTDFFVSGGGPSSSPSCSICLELVLQGGDGTGGGGRSVAKLICGHEFHLDCIGSAFNAKGAMQCPNCRKVENGRWLYANGQRSSADLDTDGWIPEDYYDFHELPFALQWCPIPGFMQISSISSYSLEEEFQPNSYNEAMGSSGFGDHSSVPSSTHRCPYLAPHGFPHAMHSVPSSSTDHVPDNDPFHRYPTSFGGQSSTNIMNPHVSENELRNQDWLQRPFTSNADQSSSHFGTVLSRIDTNSQQRAGSFTHSNPLVHGSHGSSAAVSVMAEARAPARGHGSHVYQQPVVGYRNPQLDPRRTRPRGNHHHQDGGGGGGGGDSISSTRHLNHIYGWGREQFTSLPWIPIEGESQWWSPFNPNLNLRSTLPTQQQQQGHQRSADNNGGNQNQSQSQSQNHHRDNGHHHQRMPPPPGVPPFI